MSKEVVLDIETQNAIGEVDFDNLRVSVAVAYFYDSDEYVAYLENELPALFKKLEECDRIVGFNSIGFDIPVLNRYYAGDLMKVPQLDMLDHVYKTLGFRIKLDTIAAATVGGRKSANGLAAVEWWKEGKIDQIVEYCKQDVKVTKDVYDFGRVNGFLLFDDRLGERRKVDVNFGFCKDQKTALNLTMGF